MTVLVREEVVDGIIFAFLEDADDRDSRFFLCSFTENLATVPGLYEKWREFVKEIALVVLADSNGMTEDEVRTRWATAESGKQLH